MVNNLFYDYLHVNEQFGEIKWRVAILSRSNARLTVLIGLSLYLGFPNKLTKSLDLDLK